LPPAAATSVQDVKFRVKQYLSKCAKLMKQYGALTARAKMKGLGQTRGVILNQLPR